jgi:hypothetical protein
MDLHFLAEQPNFVSAFYSAAIALSPLEQLDLEWWDKVLTQGFEAQCQTPNFSILAVAWGVAVEVEQVERSSSSSQLQDL